MDAFIVMYISSLLQVPYIYISVDGALLNLSTV